jgi:type VI protein secretion system component VasK
MIPPFIQQVLGALVRALIVWGAGYLAAHGVTVSDSQTTQFVAWATPLLGALVWSIWQKYRGRQKLVVALSTPAVMTEKQVEAVVANDGAPSVLTPKTELPR